jgi:hypothetical protein
MKLTRVKKTKIPFGFGKMICIKVVDIIKICSKQ